MFEVSERTINQLEFATAGVTSLASTALVAINTNAGEGVWRDEAASIAFAKMRLADLWTYLPYESFPPLFHLLLKSLFAAGMPETALTLRLPGLFIWLMNLTLLW